MRGSGCVGRLRAGGSGYLKNTNSDDNRPDAETSVRTDERSFPCQRSVLVSRLPERSPHAVFISRIKSIATTDECAAGQVAEREPNAAPAARRAIRSRRRRSTRRDGWTSDSAVGEWRPSVGVDALSASAATRCGVGAPSCTAPCAVRGVGTETSRVAWAGAAPRRTRRAATSRAWPASAGWGAVTHDGSRSRSPAPTNENSGRRRHDVDLERSKRRLRPRGRRRARRYGVVRKRSVDRWRIRARRGEWSPRDRSRDRSDRSVT